ncbi:MAG: Asp23/Gls24 family envelope stress response protein [Clostridiales bacterium]|nr:Asp23/Gls24 family envelope stress response protein [Clostridiales bacterium]
MSVNTSNAYGRITITEEAIAQIAGCSALECYGVVELVISKRHTGSFADMFKKARAKVSRGVRVMASGDRIYIDINIILKYGVNIEAVSQSLKKSVKYDVEKFSGMVVDTINVNVLGIKV